MSTEAIQADAIGADLRFVDTKPSFENVIVSISLGDVEVCVVVRTRPRITERRLH